LRRNRWLILATVAVALGALFVDGYAYIWRLANHIPFSAPISQAPNFLNKDIYIHKGLDLQGGTEIALSIDSRSLPPGLTMQQAQQSTINVMNKRVNGLGVSESAVQAQGTNRVAVSLPGVNFDRARNLIGRTAKLTLETWAPAKPGPNNLLIVPKDPTGSPIVDPRQVPKPEGGTCLGNNANLECIPVGYLPQLTGVDGSMITSASTSVAQTTGEPTVVFTLNDFGATKLDEVSKTLVSKTGPDNQLAIFLDNQMVNNANVQSELSNGSVEIHGGQVSSDPGYRNDLATILSSGRLPGKIDIVQATSVGASLGFDSVRRGFLAGGLGLAVVVIFMILYYRLPGLVASLALAFYAAVTLAAFKLIPVTLSLAGIAGFVLSVGMAVDANVLIFERLREELRNGRPLAAAAEAAHNRAFPAIRDSNVSTLITCFVLYMHDRLLPFVTPVTVAKGFGLTLGIGVAVSFFSAVYVTQLILELVIRVRALRVPFLFAVERAVRGLQAPA